jgi:hypothetical protein
MCERKTSGIHLNLSSKLELSIVNAPLVTLHSKNRKNTNNAKSEVRFKQLIHDL